MSDYKTTFVAVYGSNQVPFNSLEQLKQYFEDSGSLFEGIKNDIKFYEVNVKPIKPFENA